MSRKAKVRTKSILSKIFCSLIYIVLFMPIAVVVVNSFNATTSKPYLTWKGFTFDWYVKLFENQSLLTSFGNTMIIALVTTVLSTIIGTLGAIGMYKYKFKGKGIIDGLLYIPVVIPEIVMGISLLTVFAKVSIPRGMLTLIIAHITFCVPYVIFNVTPKLKQLDIKLYEAALDLGCDPRQAFFKVILPEISPAILSAFLICLTYSIDDFMISYFNCGTVETLPIAIYSMTRKKVSPEIYALSTIMFVVILCIILFSNAMESRNYRRDQKALRGEGV